MHDDEDDSFTRDRWRMKVAERLVRLEDGYSRIETKVDKNNEMTEEIVQGLIGLRTIGKALIWVASVAGAGGVTWAAFSYAVKTVL